MNFENDKLFIKTYNLIDLYINANFNETFYTRNHETKNRKKFTLEC
jgi:hypothetical protein